MRRASRLFAAVLACSAAALTGCGSGGGTAAASASPTVAARPSSTPSPFAGLSAEQISDRAKQALLSAPSVTMTLDMTMDGDGTRAKIAIDGHGHCVGRLTTPGKGNLDVLASDGRDLVRPDRRFLEATGGADVARALGGRYLDVTRSKDLKDVVAVCDRAEFMKEVTKDDGPDFTLTRIGSIATVDGVPCVVLRGHGDGGTQYLYVAAHGIPYPLKLSQEGGKDTGTLRFSGFGRPVVVHLPPRDQIIDAARFDK